MDWTHAIDRNRTALLGVVAVILALIGGREGHSAVARHLRTAALALLRPAEAAVRRLIVIAARGLTVPPRPARVPALPQTALAAGRSSRLPAFPLFDRPQRFGRMIVVAPPRGIPRIRAFWLDTATAPATSPGTVAAPARPDPDALVDVSRLCLRVASLEAALASLPRQARRLARWRARRTRDDVSKGRVQHFMPLRIGHPPGHQARSEREIDRVLRDCHALARDVMSVAALTPDRS